MGEMMQKGHGQFARERKRILLEREDILLSMENQRLFAEGNQATSNEPIIKWNCLPSYESPGVRAASWVAQGPPPPFVTTIMLI